MEERERKSGIRRREFLRTTSVVTAGVVSGLRCERANGVEREGEGNAGGGDKLTDCNVTLSRCPWRRLRLDETDALVAKLRGCGVGQRSEEHTSELQSRVDV